MITLRQTPEFAQWVGKLRDRRARERIEIRLERLKDENPGLSRSLGGGLAELKIDYGPGYRVYFSRRGPEVVLLLCGGDKSWQGRDIETARKLLSEWERDRDGA